MNVRKNTSSPQVEELVSSPPLTSSQTSRRSVLVAGAAVIGAGAVGRGAMSARAQNAVTDATAESAPASCVLAAEMTEGPYFLDGDLVRQDITEGIPGVPLKLRIGIQDATACSPLANAAVDIWHCDAQGYYSGISGENPGGGGDATTDGNLTTTFLRGIQLTDESGLVEFATIYPGWYTGRTIHIHMKVAVDGEAGQTYDDGTYVHTGQLFFDDAISDAIYDAHEAYSGRDNAQRTLNGADNILGEHVDEPGYMLELTGSIEDGYSGIIWVGVDSSATGNDGGGGQGGQGGPPSGSDGPGGSPPPNR